ncbi:MAG: PCMD domain-containing protein [Fibrobacter sp.]|nr:PCMD domain-containing protein [Fibrobacter sp.]
MFKWLGILLVAICFWACGETESAVSENAVVDMTLFDNFEKYVVDSKKFEIKLSSDLDTLEIHSLASLGGKSYYLALDGDLEDPEIDWDNPLDSGVVLVKENGVFKNIVVLDESNRVYAVWQIVLPEVKSSSSKETDGEESSSSEDSTESSSSDIAESSSSVESESSSSNEDSAESSSSDIAESSSSEKTASSSSVELESSSSEEVDESSSSEEPVESSSSDIAESSSSVEEESSSSEEEPGVLKASELSIPDGSIFVEGERIYVEMPYGTDLTKLKFNQLDSTVDLTRTIKMDFADDLGEMTSFSVKAGVQLPGSDFSKREKSFWGTTADVMSQTDFVKHNINDYRFTAKRENLKENGSSISISSELVVAAANTYVMGYIDGGWKLVSGAYFAGTFLGTRLHQLYDLDYADESGAPDVDEEVDVTQLMSLGQPFNARPESFEVVYSYVHENGENKDVPQEALIYVLLVSADNKIVASGLITEGTSVDNKKAVVALNYGSDSGILDSEYGFYPNMQVGDGSEDVATIHVMFASSAYGFITAGGLKGNDAKYRGGEGSTLTIDNFKLIY